MTFREKFVKRVAKRKRKVYNAGKLKKGSPLARAERRPQGLDPEPDLDHANVGNLALSRGQTDFGVSAVFFIQEGLPVKVKSEQLRLYAVTDRAWAADSEAFFQQITDAIDGGATFVQLREKRLNQADFLSEAARFVALCRERGVVSIINDNVEIAAQTGADGVHVGQEDLEAGRARAILGPGKIIGVSAHSVEEALRAQAAGADYLGVGAAFASSTKDDAKPIARDIIRAITAAVDIPVVAIGGITRDNILELKGCGLDGVAVVSALFAQPDVKAAAAEMLRRSQEIAR